MMSKPVLMRIWLTDDKSRSWTEGWNAHHDALLKVIKGED